MESEQEFLGMRLIQLANQAELLKNNEAFDLAIAALEQEVVREWVDADTVGARERAHAKINVIQDVVDRLDEIIGAGAIEQDRRDREKAKEDK